MSKKGTLAAVTGLVIVAVVVTLFVVRGSHKNAAANAPSNPTAAMCGALANIATYAATHPVTKTYPNLEASLAYSHQQLASVTNPPTAIASSLRTAVSSSGSMVAYIQRILAKAKITVGQQTAAVNEIPVWRKSNTGLSAWKKTHC